MAQQIKNQPAVQETQGMWVHSLSLGDPLEWEMATYSNILAWKIPYTEESGGYSPWSCKEFDPTKPNTHTQKPYTQRYKGYYQEMLIEGIDHWM